MSIYRFIGLLLGILHLLSITEVYHWPLSFGFHSRIADIVASVKELKQLITAKPSADENESSDSEVDIADGE